MSFNIVITGVEFGETGKGPKKYKMATVSYTYQGRERTQKVMAFANPGIFKTLQELTFPAPMDVEVTKDGEYTQWSKLSPVEVTKTTTQTSIPTTKVVGSNYETREERAARQAYIIKQSSISSAIEFLKLDPDVQNASVETVLNIAQAFVNFVYGTKEKVDPMDGIDEDIPV